jgi:hypothetical protein
MKGKYIKAHNNYDLTLGETYEGIIYNGKYFLVTYDDRGNEVLYRMGCFKML